MTYMKCLVLVVMALVVIGCGTKDPLQPTQARSYIMPLKIGNQWTYDLKAYYAPNQPASEYFIYYITVTDTVTINSEKWYTTAFSIPSYSLSYTGYYTNRSDGLYFRATTTPGDSVYLRFKYPARAGDTCHAAHEFFRLWWSTMPSYPAEIISTDTSIQLPWITLDCYHQSIDYVTGSANPPYVDDFFSPDTGLARSYYMLYYSGYGYYPYITWELTAVDLQ